MTIGELKKLIADIPDDMHITIGTPFGDFPRITSASVEEADFDVFYIVAED